MSEQAIQPQKTEQPEQPGQPEQPEQPQGDDRDWPTHCEYCGTELQSGVVDVIPDSDSEHLQTASPATVIAQDFCPNPDCPGKDAEITAGVTPDEPQ